jgi:chromosome segregation ATPase
MMEKHEMEELDFGKQTIIELQHEKNELSKAVGLANERIAELEAANDMLMTQLSQWKDRAEEMARGMVNEVVQEQAERILELETENGQLRNLEQECARKDHRIGELSRALEFAREANSARAKELIRLRQRISSLESDSSANG